MKFEWDDRKNKTNIAKHGVSFDEAQKAFDDPNAVVNLDQGHGESQELRWWLLGKETAGFYLFDTHNATMA